MVAKAGLAAGGEALRGIFKVRLLGGRPRLRQDRRKWEWARARANLKYIDLKDFTMERSIAEEKELEKVREESKW